MEHQLLLKSMRGWHWAKIHTLILGSIHKLIGLDVFTGRDLWEPRVASISSPQTSISEQTGCTPGPRLRAARYIDANLGGGRHQLILLSQPGYISPLVIRNDGHKEGNLQDEIPIPHMQISLVSC